MKAKRGSRAWAALFILALAGLCLAASCERAVVRDGIRMRAEEARRIDLERAEQSLTAGRYDEAAVRYRQFLDEWPRAPETAEALSGLGEAYYKQGDKAEARRIFSEVLSRYPGHPASVRAS